MTYETERFHLRLGKIDDTNPLIWVWSSPIFSTNTHGTQKPVPVVEKYPFGGPPLWDPCELARKYLVVSSLCYTFWGSEENRKRKPP